MVGLAELILTGGWYLWWERRQLTHGESVQPPSRSDLAIVSLTKNYQMAGKKGAKLRKGWRKPAEGYLMLNIDASFDEDNGLWQYRCYYQRCYMRYDCIVKYIYTLSS
jgi:hypothetical protein